MKKLTLYFSVIFLIISYTSIVAQSIISWSASTSSLTNGGPSPWTATTANANLTVTGLLKGTGVGSVSTGSVWGGNNWLGAANEDITFSVTSNAGYSVSFSSLSFTYRRSGTGPSSALVQYNLGTGTYTTITTVTNMTSTSTSGTLISPIALSGITDLQSVNPGTTVVFRIVPTCTSSVGTFYFSLANAFAVNGTVGVFSGAAVTIAQTASISCGGQASGGLSATASGGTAPYTYSWMPAGGSSSVATGLVAGNYTCLISDAVSATAAATYSLAEPIVLSTSVSAQQNVNCFGGSDGSASFFITGGVAPYTYSWLPTGGNTNTVTGLTAGTYTLNVSDANACATSQTLSISSPTALPNVSGNASNTVVCSGSTLALTGSGASTYMWSNGVADGVTFTPSASGTYTVIGTDINGCSASSTISVTVNVTPTLSINNGTICSGDSYVLLPVGANTYTFSSGSSTVAPTSSSNYSVSGTSSNGCISHQVISMVTVNALPSVSIASAAMVCSGNSLTLVASGASTYTWNTMANGNALIDTPLITTTYSVTGRDVNGCSNTFTTYVMVNSNPTVTMAGGVICSGGTFTLIPSGAATYTFSSGTVVSPTLTTSYSVSGSSSLGCVSNTAIAVVTVSNSINITVSGSILICRGQSAALTASGANTYTWNTGEMTSAISPMPLSDASYTVAGSSGSCSNTAVVSIIVLSNPTVTAFASDSSICKGQSLTLTAGGATSYTWNAANLVGSSVTFTPSATNAYSVVGMNNNGCIGSSSVEVIVNDDPTVTIASSSPTLCEGETATLTANGAASYHWSDNSATSAILVSPLQTTSYTVTGMSAEGCFNVAVISQNVATCTGLNSIVLETSTVLVFPNPNNGSFIIRGDAGAKLNLIDAKGSIIREIEHTSSVDLFINDLEPGFYFLSNPENHPAVKQKIIVTP